MGKESAVEVGNNVGNEEGACIEEDSSSAAVGAVSGNTPFFSSPQTTLADRAMLSSGISNL